MKIIKKIADAAGLQSNTIEELIDWVEELWRIQAIGRSLIGLSIPGDEKLLESSRGGIRARMRSIQTGISPRCGRVG